MLERYVRMNTLKWVQTLIGSRRPSGGWSVVTQRTALLAGLIVALCLPLWSLTSAHASGVFWLPTQKASDPSFDHLNPVLATYHNRAYVLSVRVNGASEVTSVFFSTDESGKWTTQ